ncbi:N-acetyltransferase [Neobacillus notoginsengisoli]|uniref:N-acetyltransferase n=1 Tax=Neobacillus notoginsengisoli TaxID=1578198 RepID=A0A417YFE0_9BACI|nr:GNAT family protein [Neobacillus notoginsengisoli]RHW31479.1 N-acetyltransferase [Neobacillus notoginsengisoli]
MKLIIYEMNEWLAAEILGWVYEAPYDFYNNSVTPEGIRELLDQPYYAVLSDGRELAGFFCIGESAQVPAGASVGAYTEGSIDIGIGMNPNLTGKGMGFTFFSFILTHLQDTFPGVPTRLTVASFNRRAIRLYTKIGFHETMRFQRGAIEFVVMTRE